MRTNAATALSNQPNSTRKAPEMKIQTTTRQTRHLAPVPDYTDPQSATDDARQQADKVFRLAVAAATGTPVSAPIPPTVLDRLAGLDGDAQTASDVLDLAAAEVDNARKELSEAARRLADAEERWAKAGIVADEASRAAADARHTYGVALTASGYVRQP
jgi:hypothetical protein